MYNKSLIVAVALSLTAGAGFAQDVNPGVAQLEAEAGVEAGLYSQEQLIRLLDARAKNDADIEREILANPEGGMMTTQSTTTAADAIVIPAETGMVTPDMVTVVDAGATTGVAIVEFMGVQSELNPGDVQLALEIGVAPGFYSQEQLIRLRDAQVNNKDDIARELLANPEGPLAG